ncbi:hypothetical protein YQE_12033, partial [Dendroctonus ponderosae]
MSNPKERISLKYTNSSNKFSEPSAEYNNQYCSIYLTRLKCMEPLLMERIEKKWGDKYPICKLHKLTEEKYNKCVVIGTVFKDQKLKPSVLKQLAEGNQLIPQPILTHFTDESDLLFMEDEVQRYQIVGKFKNFFKTRLNCIQIYLLGKIDGTKLVTGITCALLGTDIGKGKFEVDEHIFAEFREQVERPIFESAVYVLFVSGLNLVDQANFAPNLQLLIYWLSGAFGDHDKVSKVCRVIIAGNSIRSDAPKAKTTISMISKVTESSDTIEAVKSLDDFLLKLCQVVDVDVMPGEHDPSNHILPQKPMHFCMFPESSQYKSFNQVSNPYRCELDGFKLLGSSGQPIRDIMRFADVSTSLEAMEDCLIWNHLAPTAPDTLGCFPYYDNDPFIIDDCPHTFFCGNQPEFASKIVTG